MEGEVLKIKGDFLLVRLPSSFQEVRRETVQLSLHHPPGYFKKMPRCSTPWCTYTSSTTQPSSNIPTYTLTHKHRDGWREHYPLDLKLPLHLTRPAHPCLLPYYTGNCSCCEITHNLLLSLLLSCHKKSKFFAVPSASLDWNYVCKT